MKMMLSYMLFIMHAIIQNIRPRTVIAPLQIGLAVQMYYHFKSRYLVNALHSLGFSSYEMHLFKVVDQS